DPRARPLRALHGARREPGALSVPERPRAPLGPARPRRVRDVASRLHRGGGRRAYRVARGAAALSGLRGPHDDRRGDRVRRGRPTARRARGHRDLPALPRAHDRRRAPCGPGSRDREGEPAAARRARARATLDRDRTRRHRSHRHRPRPDPEDRGDGLGGAAGIRGPRDDAARARDLRAAARTAHAHATRGAHGAAPRADLRARAAEGRDRRGRGRGCGHRGPRARGAGRPRRHAQPLHERVRGTSAPRLAGDDAPARRDRLRRRRGACAPRDGRGPAPRRVRRRTSGERGMSEGETLHVLRATPDTCFWGFFDRSRPPVLTVRSGDTVHVETLTHQAGDAPDLMMDEGVRAVYEGIPAAQRGPGVHLMTGPIAVEGARAGDTLEVRILAMRPRLPYGTNIGAWWGYLYPEMQKERITIYAVDAASGYAQAAFAFDYEHTPKYDAPGTIIPPERTRRTPALDGVLVPLRPHFGVMGV